jgi:hypothetical protein
MCLSKVDIECDDLWNKRCFGSTPFFFWVSNELEPFPGATVTTDSMSTAYYPWFEEYVLTKVNQWEILFILPDIVIVLFYIVVVYGAFTIVMENQHPEEAK